MPARREIAGVPEDRVTKFSRWLRSEVTQKDKVAANLVRSEASGRRQQCNLTAAAWHFASESQRPATLA